MHVFSDTSVLIKARGPESLYSRLLLLFRDFFSVHSRNIIIHQSCFNDSEWDALQTQWWYPGGFSGPIFWFIAVSTTTRWNLSRCKSSNRLKVVFSIQYQCVACPLESCVLASFLIIFNGRAFCHSTESRASFCCSDRTALEVEKHFIL